MTETRRFCVNSRTSDARPYAKRLRYVGDPSAASPLQDDRNAARPLNARAIKIAPTTSAKRVAAAGNISESGIKRFFNKLHRKRKP